MAKLILEMVFFIIPFFENGKTKETDDIWYDMVIT